MLALIDDWEDFIRYDWGELVWTKTFACLKRALHGKVVLHKKKFVNNKSPKSYSLNGLPFAFQIVLSISGWVAYRETSSAIPCIMQLSCTHLPGLKARIHELNLQMMSVLTLIRLSSSTLQNSPPPPHVNHPSPPPLTQHPWVTCDCSQHSEPNSTQQSLKPTTNHIKGRLDRMEDSLQRMESSMLFVLVKLSIIRELLMVLVKVVDSQPYYGGGEGLSFNTLESQTLVGDAFVDVFTSTIDDKLVDEETRTSVSDNPKDGIIPIDVPSKGEDMPPLPPQPLPPQPLLESKDEPLVFSDVVPKKGITKKTVCNILVKSNMQFLVYLVEPQRATELWKTVRSSRFDLQTDSQVQSQTVNQLKAITDGGEGTSDVKQKGVVGRPQQQGKMYALGQRKVEETPNTLLVERKKIKKEWLKVKEVKLKKWKSWLSPLATYFRLGGWPKEDKITSEVI
uniref:Uncharacterized protein n=1 Tax=Cucumis sativus TaxID=3659 RepID=A0A0A0KIM1_CUCSA